MFFFISLYMQQVLGYSADPRRALLPAAGADDHRLAPGSPRCLVTKVGYKPVLAAGLLFIFAGLRLVQPGLGRRRLH